jgi:hypothetical protein
MACLDVLSKGFCMVCEQGDKYTRSEADMIFYFNIGYVGRPE